MRSSVKNIIKFIAECEKLKDELRHSWSSRGRQESVAEHSWRVAIMLLACEDHLPKNFNILKALKMSLLHDIGEVYAKDIHYAEVNKNCSSILARATDEERAICRISEILNSQKSDIYDIWKEFADNVTQEATVVNCLDKLEACIQHYQADISTWTRQEFAMIEGYFDEIMSSCTIIEELKFLTKQLIDEKLNKRTGKNEDT